MNDISTMNKIVEYMALGQKTMVQFDPHEGRVSAGDASEYADRNDAASLAKYIVQPIDDPEARARMGKIGLQRANDRAQLGNCKFQNSWLPTNEL